MSWYNLGEVLGLTTEIFRQDRWSAGPNFNPTNFLIRGMTDAQGRAMAQAVGRRPPTAEARVRSRVSPCGICGDTGTGFSPSSSVFPCQFHSTGAPLLGKGQKMVDAQLTST
jgi:hypothetical protein